MSDDQGIGGHHATPDAEGETSGKGGPWAAAPDWSDIGRQLEELGASLAGYIRATMNDPETKRHAAEVRAQLQHAASAVGDAMSEAARSETGQKVYSAATSVAGAAVATGQKVAGEVRPHLADAIRKANEAVRAAADSITTRGAATGEPEADAPAAETPVEGGAAAGGSGEGAK